MKLKQQQIEESFDNFRQPAYWHALRPAPSQIQGIQTFEGQTIENRVELLLANKEPITDGAPEIFTDRKDGVIPEYNIRTDRMEQLLEVADQLNKNAELRRKIDRERRTNPEGKKTENTNGDTPPNQIDANPPQGTPKQ